MKKGMLKFGVWVALLMASGVCAEDSAPGCTPETAVARIAQSTGGLRRNSSFGFRITSTTNMGETPAKIGGLDGVLAPRVGVLEGTYRYGSDGVISYHLYEGEGTSRKKIREVSISEKRICVEDEGGTALYLRTPEGLRQQAGEIDLLFASPEYSAQSISSVMCDGETMTVRSEDTEYGWTHEDSYRTSGEDVLLLSKRATQPMGPSGRAERRLSVEYAKGTDFPIRFLAREEAIVGGEVVEFTQQEVVITPLNASDP